MRGLQLGDEDQLQMLAQLSRLHLMLPGSGARTSAESHA